MKKIAYNTLLILCIALPGLALANKDGETFRKDFSDSFSVSQGDNLELQTNFASVNIVNWDKNEVSISGFVEVEAKSRDKAQDIAEKTKVEMKKAGPTVELHVELGNWDGGKYKTASHEIEFTIRAPRWMNLEGHATFGNVEVDQLDGMVNFDLEYGEFSANHLSHSSNDLAVSFGSADIGTFGGGEISMSFSSFDLDMLRGNLEFNNSYGEADIRSMSAEVNDLEIDNSFGECSVEVYAGHTYVVDSESSFGDVDFHGNWEVIRSDKDFNSKDVKGKLGNGDSENNRIDISNSFGSVNLRSK